MKAYGLPRFPELEYPDVGDIQTYALASHVGRVPTDSREYKSYTRSTKNRRATRRYYKKKCRRLIKMRLRHEESK